MKQVRVIDTTFSHAKELTFKEKLILARQLAALGVDLIEMGGLTASGEDQLFIKAVQPFVDHVTVSAVVPADGDAAAIWETLAPLSHKRLSVKMPTSVVQMEYFCHMKPDKVLEKIISSVSDAAKVSPEVEFVALDATRSESAFLKSACEAAITAGATAITLCDSEGVMMPLEITAFIKSFFETVTLPAGVKVSFEASNTLSMACANSVAATLSGVDGIYTTLCGDTAVELSAFVKAVAQRGNDWQIATGVDATAIKRGASSMAFLYGEKSETAATAVETVENADEIILAKGTTISQLADVIAHMGYELTSDDVAKVYASFEKLVERKQVTGKELDMIIADVAYAVPPTYILRSYIVNSGDRMSPMAQVEIEKDGEVRNGVSIGDGPIDAAFLAVERVIGTHYELDDFRISSVTRGQEAMGEALVRLRCRGKVYSGSGISTDIIGASLKAYVNALNKIVFEEQ